MVRSFGIIVERQRVRNRMIKIRFFHVHVFTIYSNEYVMYRELNSLLIKTYAVLIGTKSLKK